MEIKINRFSVIEPKLKKEAIKDIQQIFKFFSNNPQFSNSLSIIGYICFKFDIKQEDLNTIIKEEDKIKALQNLQQIYESEKEKFSYIG